MSPSRSTVTRSKSIRSRLWSSRSLPPFYGKLVFVRVYSGSVVPGDSVLDSTRGKGIGKIFQMHADKENPMDRADAGNIYTFVGLKKNVTR